MVAGGLAYELSELIEAETPTKLPTGLARLDEFTGGIEPGAMWAISGIAGIGISSLALTIAANAARSGDVIVCNGHLPSRATARQLAQLAGDGRRPRLASWFRLMPEPPDVLGDTSIERADLLVADTWDEAWHAAPWPTSRADLTRHLRWLRHLGREHNTAILLTARTPRTPSDDVLGWMVDAFEDAADVAITLSDPTGAALESCAGRRATVRARGTGFKRFRYVGGSKVRLTPEA
jgi:hypothetical protein